MARNRRCKPVSVTYRTGLEFAETAIGKWQAETGAAKPPVQRRNSRICRPETRARQPNPRECWQFSHSRKTLGSREAAFRAGLDRNGGAIGAPYSLQNGLDWGASHSLAAQPGMAKRSEMKGIRAALQRPILEATFVSSNPPTPASQCGLSYSISGHNGRAILPDAAAKKVALSKVESWKRGKSPRSS